MSNFVTMVLVLGGTLFGGVLLYFSRLPGSPRTDSSKRRTEATAVVAAASDRDREEVPSYADASDCLATAMASNSVSPTRCRIWRNKSPDAQNGV